MLEVGEQRVVLDPCSWDTYERILREQGDHRVPKFSYDAGVLEIMSPSAEHEQTNEAVKQIVYVACEALGLEVEGLGSTTQRRPELAKGAEPDSSFFFGDVGRDAAVHPPDLVVEIELSRSALDKLNIFCTLGIPEVWRFRDGCMRLYHLSGDSYVSAQQSRFVGLTDEAITSLLTRRRTVSRRDWLESIREAARRAE